MSIIITYIIHNIRYVSRGHQSYVNEMEQFYVRYVKENSCYAASDYIAECAKYPSENLMFKLEQACDDFDVAEFPASARFSSVEGLFNPEIWGIDGEGKTIKFLKFLKFIAYIKLN